MYTIDFMLQLTNLCIQSNDDGMAWQPHSSSKFKNYSAEYCKIYR